MKTIYQYKQSPISCAPDELVRCLNKYSNRYNGVLAIDHKQSDKIDFIDHPNIPVIHDVTIDNIESNADLIHFHNLSVQTSVPSIIHYHSPPGTPMNMDFIGTKLVVDQYQSRLPEFRDCKPSRIILDIYDYSYNQNTNYDKIKIGFSPTVMTGNGNKSHESKGWPETEEILLKLQKDYFVDFDIIHGVPLGECLQRKSECNILIADCVTDSYHRSGLEGLALGKLTISSVGDDVGNIMKNKTNSDVLPFENVLIDDLEAYLIDVIVKRDINWIIEKGKWSRKWMETYWSPKSVLKDYEDIYDYVLSSVEEK